MTELRKALNGEWYFIVKAKNGKILLTSEMYKRKANARKGIKALVKGMKKIVEA